MGDRGAALMAYAGADSSTQGELHAKYLKIPGNVALHIE